MKPKLQALFLLILFLLFFGPLLSAQTLWQVVDDVPTAETLLDVHFLDSNTGWVVGENGTIIHTNNGGDTWTDQDPEEDFTENLNSVFFTDSQNGWIVGGGGTILHTSDGGDNWSEQDSETTAALNAVYFTDANTGWVAGTSGTILHTDDGGDTWIEQDSDTDRALFGISFTDANTGWVVGNAYTVIQTNDGGNTWEEVNVAISNSSADQFRDVFFVNSQTGWIAGGNFLNSSIIYRTEDGGQTWDADNITFNQFSNHINAITGANELTLFGVNDGGQVFFTNNGGQSWSIMQSSMNARRGITFVDQTGWAVGINGQVRKFEAPEAPDPPLLAGPSDGSIELPTNPLLEWNSVTGADHYHLQVSEEDDFSDLTLFETNITPTSHQLSGLDHNTTYYWRVVAANNGGAGEWAGTNSFTTIIESPDVVVLTSPDDGLQGASTDFDFEWEASDRADHYHLQVSEEDDFSTLAMDEDNILDTSFTADLDFNTTYFWRVSATNDGGTSDWSDVRNFTTIIETPDIVTLTSPQEEEIVEVLDPELQWEASDRADTYHLQVSVEDDFSTTLVDEDDLTETTFQLTGLTQGETYYWRVSATNDGGTSDWSDILAFAVFLDTPEAVELISPADSAAYVFFEDPILYWEETELAETYHLQFSDEDNFTSAIIDEDDLQDLFYELNSLDPGETYFWRVRASNASGNGDWSETNLFQTFEDRRHWIHHDREAPFDGIIHSLFFIDEKTGWAAGDGARISKTADGGQRWEHLETGITANRTFNDLFFLDENNGWAVGNSSTIIHTADGGSTWIAQNALGNFRSVTFVDPLTGWVAGTSRIYHTTDGGENWVEQDLPESVDINEITFTDSQTGWAVANSSTILHTSDGGETWTVQLDFDDTEINFSINSISMVNSSTGIAVGGNHSGIVSQRFGVILRTSDGGENWDFVEADIPLMLHSVVHADENTLWAAGREGNIFYSTNGGLTWIEQENPFEEGSNIQILSLAFFDSGTGWAAGSGGTLLRYHDPDPSLPPLVQPPEELALIPGENEEEHSVTLSWDASVGEIESYNIYRGTSVGQMSLLATVSSDTLEYRDDNPLDGTSYYALRAVDVNQAKSDFTEALLYYTQIKTIAGEWELISNPGSNFSLDSQSGSRAFWYVGAYESQQTIFGLPGRGYWVINDHDGHNYNTRGVGETEAAITLNKGWNLIGSLGDTVQVSSIEDLSGETLTDAPVYVYLDGAYEEVTELVPGLGHWIFADEEGQISFSVNTEPSVPEEQTKEVFVESGLYNGMNQITFTQGIASQNFWVSGSFLDEVEMHRFLMPPMAPGPMLDVRTAGGYRAAVQNAEQIQIKASSFPVGVKLAESDHNSEHIYRIVARDDDGEVHINLFPGREQFILEEYDSYMLERIHESEAITETGIDPNFPNPFNPSTNIRYRLAQQAEVSIHVYDVVGRRVTTLVNRQQQPGTYTVQFDGSSLASGVYFLRIHAGNFVDVQKLTLIK